MVFCFPPRAFFLPRPRPTPQMVFFFATPVPLGSALLSPADPFVSPSSTLLAAGALLLRLIIETPHLGQSLML